MSKRDIIIVIVLIVVALIGFGVVNFLNKGDQGTVLITVNGDIYNEIALADNIDQSFRIDTNGDWNDIIIRDGKVDVIAANCPTQICVETKAAEHNGDMIVCLPHKMIVEIIPK
jgi:hypothetical protein